MCTAIFAWPIETQPANTDNITSSTRSDWGYTAQYCDNFWDSGIEEQINEHTKKITFNKVYCSI